jgi:hypothetical protein
MDQDLNSTGICGTCHFRPGCPACKNAEIRGSAILHCDEFDDLPATVLDNPSQKVESKRDAGDKWGSRVNSPRAKGLCVNCNDAEICKFAGFGEEVVFCEEHSSNFDNALKDRASHRIFANQPDLGIKKLIPGLDS